MYLRDLDAELLAAKYAATKRERPISLELISPPGVGKSDKVAQYVEKHETAAEPWFYQELFLATSTPADLIGYIFKGEREFNGTKVLTSEPCLPMWMIDKRTGKHVSEFKNGVLFLDEYGQGDAETKRASAQLMLKGELGPWRLHNGIQIIAASNRANDRSGVTKAFDFVINRRGEIHVSPDLQSWEEWALAEGVHPFFVYFAHQHPDVVFQGKVPETQGPWCTPRSFMMAERYLVGKIGGDRTRMVPTDSLSLEMVTGMIGKPAANAMFVAARLADQLPSYDEICNKPADARIPQGADAKMLLTYQCAARVAIKEFPAVTQYIERLPAEFSVQFIQAATERDRNLIATKTVGDWCRKHAHLVAAIQR